MIKITSRTIIFLVLALIFLCVGRRDCVYANDETVEIAYNADPDVLELRRQKTQIYTTTYLAEQFELLLVSEPEVLVRVERVYDEDRDQKMQETELRDFFNDVCSAVERRGNFAIKTPLLRLFDKNDDGFINLVEAQFIKKLLS